MKGLQKLMISLGLDLSQWGDGITKAKRQFDFLQKRITKGLKRIGLGAVMVAGSMTGLFGMGELMAQHSRHFETLQSKVGATDREMVSLKEDVYELNAALGLRSVSEAAGKFSMVARMSRTTGDELKRLTYQTGLLGKMFGEEEYQLGAQVALMKAFKTSAGEAGDVVAYLNKQGGDLKGELLESIREYSVQFAEAGFSLDQSVAVLKAGLSEGWNVDKAADAFKEARIRLMGGEKAAVDALQLLGLGDLDNQIKQGLISIPSAMSTIQGELAKLNPSEQMRIAKEIFGAPYEDVGAGAMTAMLEGMNKEIHYTGAIDRMSASLSNRFSHKWDMGISNMISSFSRMLDSIKPHILPLVEWFTELTDEISEFSRRYEYITKAIGLSIGGFTAITAVLGAFAIAAGTLGVVFTVLTSPITWIIAAIVGIGVGLYYLEKKTGVISTAFTKWLDIVTTYFSRVRDTVDAVKDLFENGISVEGLLNVAEKAAKALLTPFDTLFGVDLVEMFKTTVSSWATSINDSLIDPVQTFFEQDLSQLFLDTIAGWGTALGEKLMEPINKFRNSAVGKFLGLVDEHAVIKPIKKLRKSAVGKFLGLDAQPSSTISSQSIRKSKTPATLPGGSIHNPYLKLSATSSDTDTEKKSPYQIYIQNYHSNSRNAVADWDTLVVAGG